MQEHTDICARNAYGTDVLSPSAWARWLEMTKSFMKPVKTEVPS